MYFGHLKLEKTAHELLVGAAYGDFGVVVLVVHVGNDGAHRLALAEKVAGDAFALGQQQLVLFVVEQEGLAAPCLVHLAAHQLSLEVFEFLEDGFVLQVEDFALECLAQIEDGAAAELVEEYFLGVLLAHFRIGVVVGAGVGQGYFEVGVLHFAVGHYREVLENLHVALVGVQNHVQVLVGAEHFGEHVAEGFLQHAYHRGLVDVFQFLELGELFYHVGGCLFLSHSCRGIY